MVARRPGAVDRLLTREATLNQPLRPDGSPPRRRWRRARAPRLGWQDAEVVVDTLGGRRSRLTGTVAARAEELGVTHVHLSITHDSGIASAFVICEAL